jgi:hypothetical protein
MESSEGDSFINGSADSHLTLPDSKPVVARSDSSVGGWSPHLRDLHILSFSFLFTFLAYGALQNLESSLHGVSYSGATFSLSVLIKRAETCHV